MATYVRPSMSPAGLELTRDLFEALAKGAETFVFVYLGMAAVTFPIFHNTVWALAAATLVACLVGRLHVFVGAAVTNCVRRACRDRTRGTARTLNLKQSFCIWFSGLRGGVAFAIAAASYGDTDFPTRCAGWQPSSPGEPRPNPQAASRTDILRGSMHRLCSTTPRRHSSSGLPSSLSRLDASQARATKGRQRAGTAAR